MAPIRRYLRITQYSVLEVRIYLDNPALAHTWLLNPRKPILPKVLESVRPLVLPKLREEKERARKRSTKKRRIKDVVVEDEFEVSIFLTETNTRHSILTKHKHFHDTSQTKLISNSGRLVGASNEAPFDVDLDRSAAAITLNVEDSEDEDAAATLANIPTAPEQMEAEPLTPGGTRIATRRPKRARRNTSASAEPKGDNGDGDLELTVPEKEDADEDGLFVPHDPARSSPTEHTPPAKRRKDFSAGAEVGKDKKKLVMDISYEGFSIYGRVLCLVIKRRDLPKMAGPTAFAPRTGSSTGARTKNGGATNGQAMMENFIISTQIPAGEEDQSATS